MDQQPSNLRPGASQPAIGSLTVVVSAANSVAAPPVSFDTLSVPEVESVDLPAPDGCFDSADDAFAATYGLRRAELSSSEREVLSALLGGLREACLAPMSPRSAGAVPEDESLAVPQILVRCSPAFKNAAGASVLWIESSCPETGETLLPDIAWLTEGLPEAMIEARGGCLWERFGQGNARLTLEFDPDRGGGFSLRPWIAPECADEALRHMTLSIRTRGAAGPSALHLVLVEGASSVLRDAGVPLPRDLSTASLTREIDLRPLKVSCNTQGSTCYDFELYRRGGRARGSTLQLSAAFSLTSQGGYGLHTLVVTES